MNSGRESEVVADFVRWLEAEGWTVTTEVDWVDVVAERAGERLIGEAKGMTSAPGLDADTMMGQVLRRMTDEDETLSTRATSVDASKAIEVSAAAAAVAWPRPVRSVRTQ